MDNLRAVIKNLFNHISPTEIINENVSYNDINEETFKKLSTGYNNQYSNDEFHNMYLYLKHEFGWQRSRLFDQAPTDERSEELNVFDTLMAFTSSVLIEENGEPLCQYQHLLRWRDMITSLDEDLFVTSFLAMQDSISRRKRRDFFWKPVIGHNNYALNRLVGKGVAENHFHLNGSAPMFHLSWLSLMNCVCNRDFERILEGYDSNRLHKNINYDVHYVPDRLVTMWKQAALIRLNLFAQLKDDYIDFEHTYFPKETLLECCKNRSRLESVIAKRESGRYVQIDLEDYREEFDEVTLKALKRNYAYKRTNELLRNSQKLDASLGIIQKNIDRMKRLYGKSTYEKNYYEKYNYTKYDYTKYDYAICEQWLCGREEEQFRNDVLAGERWFLYSVFLYVYENREDWKKNLNWFYLYLVIKANIRNEIIQSNKNVGFDNFKIYQERKEDFINGTEYENIYKRMAVRDTIFNQHITSLEARITPKGNWRELQKNIQSLDEAICKNLKPLEVLKLKNRFFYVIHFIKGSDENTEYECRHYGKRQTIKKQALALAELRQMAVEESNRIHGIDAASAEIGCRPEVFSHAFRYLRNLSVEDPCAEIPLLRREERPQNLMATYHVGEDFLDIVDGLRAIDEAIYFLDLRCGDRLGHALALGINIDEWYTSKGYRLLISKQDYLDNLVWLYAKIRHFCIRGCEDAQIYIEKRFTDYFNEIYINNINTQYCNDLLDEARDYFDSRKIAHGYKRNNLKFGINEYYDAWKLRGDSPQLYKRGYFRQAAFIYNRWDYYAINRNYPSNYKIRYTPEVSLLYHMYHYDPQVYKIGNQMVEIKVRDCVIDALKKVRLCMQKVIAQTGIGIETNPSSNYLIGTFKRYDKHPIINWYNAGLTSDPEVLASCPQMQVSINTDDQGVFSTYIENEYAYLALALEKCKDKEGNYLYSRNSILQWLENIREMGNDQSFIS